MLYGTICKSLVGATLGTWAGARMREQRSEIRRTGSCALLTGITLGAGLMYLWDFDNGRRRRAAAKDKLASLARRSSSAVAGAARDARNRAQGLARDLAGRVSPAPASEPLGNGGNGHATATDRAWEGT